MRSSRVSCRCREVWEVGARDTQEKTEEDGGEEKKTIHCLIKWCQGQCVDEGMSEKRLENQYSI